MSMKIGYIRVSTQEQNTVRQEDLMERLGVELVYMDKLSGKARDRPALQTMMDFVRAGDTVVVESISRFARNTRDLLELIEQLREKGVEFQSQKEAIDTTTPSGKFMLTVFGAVAELEREYILQRQQEGIAIAKAKRRYCNGLQLRKRNAASLPGGPFDPGERRKALGKRGPGNAAGHVLQWSRSLPHCH